MNIKKNQALWIILSTFLLISCDEEKFVDPPWYKGTIHETLKDRGNYTNMLKLIERADYDEAIEKGLFTIFAADDAAFQEYFEKEGISSIDDLSDYDALQLFTLNIMNTARSREQLIYDYVNRQWEYENSELGALLFRWFTRSRARIGIDTSRYFESTAISIGDPVYIYGNEKLVPLISKEFFRDFRGSPDGSDYTFFFPDTKWSGFQWYNANVEEVGVRCSNGYLYFLDKVVPEIPSVEEYLRNNQDKYGLFYSIAQKFASYTLQSEQEGVKLFNKSYIGLSNLAQELGPVTGHPSYTRKAIFTALIPTNQVLQDYIDNHILNNFESIDSVPDVTLIYLLQAHITEHFDLVSKMKEIFYNYYGDVITINPDEDFTDAILLSNAAFYEVNRVLEPLAFKSVCGPLFYNNNYSTLLHILNKASQVLPSLSREDVYATVLAPSNEKFEEYGIRYNKSLDEVQKKDNNGLWKVMTPEQISELAKDHFLFESLEDFNGKGVKNMQSGINLYFEDNTLVAGGNQEDGDQVEIIEIIDSKVNGRLMLVDNVVKSPEYDIINKIAIDPEFSDFLDICYDAGLVDTIEDITTGEEILKLSFLTLSEKWTAFIPDNNAMSIASGLGDIPADSLGLVEFIQYHFIKDVRLTDYMDENGTYETARFDETTIEYSSLDVSISTENISITDLSGQTVDVPHATANNFAKDGIIQRIGNILKYE